MTFISGPYRNEGGAVKAVSHGRWFTVAHVVRGKMTPEAREATAQLFAAAPELLDAAQDVVRQAELSNLMLPADLADSIRVFLRAAITKAEAAK